MANDNQIEFDFMKNNQAPTPLKSLDEEIKEKPHYKLIDIIIQLTKEDGSGRNHNINKLDFILQVLKAYKFNLDEPLKSNEQCDYDQLTEEIKIRKSRKENIYKGPVFARCYKMITEIVEKVKNKEI